VDRVAALGPTDGVEVLSEERHETVSPAFLSPPPGMSLRGLGERVLVWRTHESRGRHEVVPCEGSCAPELGGTYVADTVRRSDGGWWIFAQRFPLPVLYECDDALECVAHVEVPARPLETRIVRDGDGALLVSAASGRLTVRRFPGGAMRTLDVGGVRELLGVRRDGDDSYLQMHACADHERSDRGHVVCKSEGVAEVAWRGGDFGEVRLLRFEGFERALVRPIMHAREHAVVLVREEAGSSARVYDLDVSR